MTTLPTSFLGRDLASPLVLASGIWGTTVSLLAACRSPGMRCCNDEELRTCSASGARQPHLH